MDLGREPTGPQVHPMQTVLQSLNYLALVGTVATCGLLLIGYGDPMRLALAQSTCLIAFMGSEIAARLLVSSNA